MIILTAITCSNLKKSTQILLKSRLQILATPTSITIGAMALKFFPTLFSDYKGNLLKDF